MRFAGNWALGWAVPWWVHRSSRLHGPHGLAADVDERDLGARGAPLYGSYGTRQAAGAERRAWWRGFARRRARWRGFGHGLSSGTSYIPIYTASDLHGAGRGGLVVLGSGRAL